MSILASFGDRHHPLSCKISTTSGIIKLDNCKINPIFRQRGLNIVLRRKENTLIFSRSCEYALQAVTFIASQPEDTPVLSRDISGALNIPPHFLGKILQTLVKHNILGSQKGRSGGFVITRPPKEIMLYDIIQVMDGPDYFEQCIMGFPGCFDHNPCPAHAEWNEIKTVLMKLLNARSISELSSDLDFKLEYIKKIVDKAAL